MDLIGAYREIENSYIENFSNREECVEHILFRDELLPDMYAFNCVLVRETLKIEEMCKHASALLAQAKAEGRDFLKLLYDPRITITEGLETELKQMGFETQRNLYMRIDAGVRLDFATNPEAEVKIATTEFALEAGLALDIKTSVALGMPEEFSIRKAGHKKDTFLKKGKLKSYLCWYHGEAVGKCELHTWNGYAKIEDFDVLETHRKRGFGTAMLKQMILDARAQDIEHIYLITGKEDTPRQMYSKLGFEIIGEELEVFWKK